MAYKSKAKASAVNKVYREGHKSEMQTYQQCYRDSHKLEKEHYNETYKIKFAAITSAKREAMKRKTLTHYGNGKCECVKCGFGDIRALSLDHINGGGYQQRKKIGIEFYKWIVKNNYPEGFQTLCMNCNWIKRFENKEHFKGKSANIVIEQPLLMPIKED